MDSKYTQAVMAASMLSAAANLPTVACPADSRKHNPYQRPTSRHKSGPAADRRQDARTLARTAQRIGRNDQCTCGSGKKYKKCCGKPAVPETYVPPVKKPRNSVVDPAIRQQLGTQLLAHGASEAGVWAFMRLGWYIAESQYENAGDDIKQPWDAELAAYAAATPEARAAVLPTRS